MSEQTTTQSQPQPPALEVDDLTVQIRTQRRARLTPLRSASMRIERGEMVGLVGESGSGKTIFSRAVSGLLAPGLRPTVTGTIKVNGHDLSKATASRRADALKHDISYVFQDPNAHLNPTMRIGAQIAEAIHGSGRTVPELLEAVGLPSTPDYARLYPHHLSGGMKQRVIIACALAKSPEFLIADEPTTALDVTIQAQVLRLLSSLVHTERVGILLVSHDLAVVGQFCSRVYVMYDGQIVESGPTEDVLWRPQHEYTQSLMAAMRRIYEPDALRRSQSVDGAKGGSDER